MSISAPRFRLRGWKDVALERWTAERTRLPARRIDVLARHSSSGDSHASHLCPCSRRRRVRWAAVVPSQPCTQLPLTHADSRGRERDGPVDTKGPHPLAKYKGLTSGEWPAVWWQAVFATAVEAGNHPLIDGGAFGGNNRTVFLGGPVLPAGSPKVTIPVTVPPGTHLVVPIITVECSVAEAAAVPWRGRGPASRVRERSSRPGVGPLLQISTAGR